MLKLQPAREPFWLDIAPGVRIQFKPIGVVAMMLARTSGGAALISAQSDKEIYGGVAFTRALAQWGIIAWDGVGDADGAVLEPTPDLVDQLLEQNYEIFQAIDRLYVGPAILKEAEKNASSVSLNGASATTGTPTARPAKRGARNARTPNTSSKRTKAS